MNRIPRSPIHSTPRALALGALLSVSLLAGCGQKNETATNELLSYIPADSPVVVEFEVNDRVFPKRLVEKYTESFDALLAFQRENIKLEFAKVRQTSNNPQGNKFIEKMEAFLDKWLDPEKIRTLGFDPADVAAALYTDQLVPIARVKLKPDHQMEAFWDELFALIEEIRQESGSNGSFVMEKTKTDTAVEYLVKANDTRFIVHLADKWLVMSVAPVVVYEKLKDEITGLKKPQKSLANTDVLKDFYSKYGYQPGQVFWVDILSLASYVVDPKNHPSALMEYYSENEPVSPVCKQEFLQLIGHFPRLVGGITAVDNHQLGNQVLWEMDNTVAPQLTKLEGEIPPFLDTPELAFGMSFDLPGSIAAAAELAQAVIQQPFQCPQLQELNLAAKTLQAATLKPLPPFVGNFKGFGFSLKNLELNLDNVDFNNINLEQADNLGHVEAAFGITFENVPALLGLAQLTSPNLAKLNIKPDGTPVDLSQLPELQAMPIPAQLKPLWLAMTTDRLILTAGIEKPAVAKKLASTPGYDKLMKSELTAELYLELMQQAQSLQNATSVQPTPQELQKTIEIWRKYLQKSLWWERQDINMDFTQRGIEIDIETTY